MDDGACDLKEREEIVWSRFVLLEQNSHSCHTIHIIITIIVIIITIIIMMIIIMTMTCIHVWHCEIHRSLPG